MKTDELLMDVKSKLPDIKISDMDVVNVSYNEAGFADFTGAGIQKRFCIQLEYWDANVRIQAALWTDKISK